MDRGQNTNNRLQTPAPNTSELHDTFDLQTLSARGLLRDFSDLSQVVRTLWARSTTSATN